MAVGVNQLKDSPASSLSTEQAEVLPQRESCEPLDTLQAMVAPLTGVTPSEATARTWIGLAVCDPTGVDGSAPCSRSKRSVAAAP